MPPCAWIASPHTRRAASPTWAFAAEAASGVLGLGVEGPRRVVVDGVAFSTSTSVSAHLWRIAWSFRWAGRTARAPSRSPRSSRGSGGPRRASPRRRRHHPGGGARPAAAPPRRRAGRRARRRRAARRPAGRAPARPRIHGLDRGDLDAPHRGRLDEEERETVRCPRGHQQHVGDVGPGDEGLQAGEREAAGHRLGASPAGERDDARPAPAPVASAGSQRARWPALPATASACPARALGR